MMSETNKIKLGNHLVKYKDGYYVVTELKTAKETGKEYESEAKTFPRKTSFTNHMVKNGYALGDIKDLIERLGSEYSKVLGLEIIQRREADKKRAQKLLEGENEL